MGDKPKFLNRDTLNAEEKKRMEELLARDPSTFGEIECAHLRARIDYLSSDEREMLGDVLIAPKKDNANKDGSADGQKDANAMTKAEIMELLDEAGTPYDPKATKAELTELLSDDEDGNANKD